jgi:phosphoserine phosphatase
MQHLLQRANAVALDVDSTVINEEGIDLLANAFNALEQVQRITNQAMNGNINMQDALGQRLDIIQPNKQGLDKLLESRPHTLTRGVQLFVQTLHQRGTHVYLVSGGFRQMIEPIRRELDIPPERVYANELLFDDTGKYVGIDTTQPTSRSGGKREVAKKLKELYDVVVFIGDGVTDLEARPPADLFIGFGGVQVREKVKAECDWFVTSFAELQEFAAKS